MSNLATLKQQLAQLSQYETYRTTKTVDMLFEDQQALCVLLQDCWEWMADELEIVDGVKNYYSAPVPNTDYVYRIFDLLAEKNYVYRIFENAARGALRMNALAKELGGSWVAIVEELGMTVEEIDQGGCSFDLGARTMLLKVRQVPDQMERLLKSFDKLPEDKKNACTEVLLTV